MMQLYDFRLRSCSAALSRPAMFWLLWTLVGQRGRRRRHGGGDADRVLRACAATPRPQPSARKGRSASSRRRRRKCRAWRSPARGVDSNVATLNPTVNTRGAMSRMGMSRRFGPRRHPARPHRAGLPAARAEPRPRRLGAGPIHDHSDRHGQGRRWSSTPDPKGHLRRRRAASRSPAGATTRRSKAALRSSASAYRPSFASSWSSIKEQHMRTHCKPFSALAAMVFAIGASAGQTHDAVASAGGARGSGSSAGPRPRERAGADDRCSHRQGLNEAIELLNMENYAGAKQKIGTLNLEKLSPYERSKVEQILFNIAVTAREIRRGAAASEGGHRRRRVERAGGLQARYQYAQLFMHRGEMEGRCRGAWRSGSRRRRTRTPPPTTCSPWRTTRWTIITKRWRPRKKPSSSWTSRRRRGCSYCSLCTSRRSSTGTRYRFSSA